MTMLDTIIIPEARQDRADLFAATKENPSLVKAAERVANTDSELALVEAVGRALWATGYLALRGIEVEIDRDIAVLWGRVPNFHQKQLAQAVAQKIDGVRGIANGIEVVCRRWSTSEPGRRP